MDWIDVTDLGMRFWPKRTARVLVLLLVLMIGLFGLKPTAQWLSGEFVRHTEEAIEDFRQSQREQCDAELAAAVTSPTTSIFPSFSCVFASPVPTTP